MESTSEAVVRGEKRKEGGRVNVGMQWTKRVKSGNLGRGVLVWGKLDVAFEMRLAFLFVSERRRFLFPFSWAWGF